MKHAPGKWYTVILLVATLALAPGGAAQAVTTNWFTKSNTSQWTAYGNWSAGHVPLSTEVLQLTANSYAGAMMQDWTAEGLLFNGNNATSIVVWSTGASGGYKNLTINGTTVPYVIQVVSGSGGVMGGNRGGVSNILGSATDFHFKADADSSLTYSSNGNISGDGKNLSFTGPGALTLNAANTFGGSGNTFTLNSGTLNINNAAALGDAANTFVINGGTFGKSTTGALMLNYPQLWNGDFTFSGSANITNSTGAVTLGGDTTATIASGRTLTIGSAINGAGRDLAFTGPGTLTLESANTFGGGGNTFTLNSGTLNINNAAALGDAANTFVINGGTFGTTGGALALNYPQLWNSDFTFSGSADITNSTGAVTLGGDVAATIASGRTLIINQGISGSGHSLTKDGTGTLQLGGASTYTGGTVINNGKLSVTTGANRLPIGEDLTIHAPGIFDDRQTQTVGGLYGTGAITNEAPANNPILTVSSGDFSGTIRGKIALTKTSAGTLVLSGNNTYTDTTTVSHGTLQVGNGGTTGQIGNNVSNVTVTSGATLKFYRSTNGYAFTNAISGAGDLVFEGTGVQQESTYQPGGDNSGFTGAIQINQARLTVDAATDLGASAITVSDGGQLFVLAGAGTIARPIMIAGNGWNGSVGYLGALRLESITYSGNITLAADARIGTYGNSPTITGNITGPYRVELSGLDRSGSTITLSPATGNTADSVLLSSGATINVSGAGGLGTGALAIDNSTVSSGANTFTLGNSELEFQSGGATFNTAAGGTVTIGNAVTGTGGLTKDGAGGLTLTGANTYSGLTVVRNSGSSYAAGGRLTLANPSGAAIQGNVQLGSNSGGNAGAVLFMNAANQFGPSSVLTFNNPGTQGRGYFILNGHSQTLAGLSATSDHELIQNSESADAGAATLTVNNTSDYSYAGVIRRTYNGAGVGALNLNKTGTGTLTLAGANIFSYGNSTVAYIGDVTVAEGHLKFSDAIYVASRNTEMTLTVDAGATLEFATSGATLHNIGSTGTGGITIDGAGTLVKSGTGTLALSNQGTSSYVVTLAMTGGLIDVQGGTLRNGGWQGQVWSDNRSSLNIASGAFFEIYDGINALC